ncbi:MAG TPA: hypothetical protein VIK92_07935 [Thermaerobacter sp.]
MALIAAALLVALVAGCLWPVPYVEVEAGRAVVYRARVRAGQRVALDYMHSLFRRPVREEFRVTAAGLLLTRIASTTPEIDGYYALPRARLRRVAAAEGRRYELVAGDGEGLLPPVRRLAVRATAVGKRTLVVGGTCYRLPGGGDGHRATLVVLRWRPSVLGVADAVAHALRGGNEDPCLIEPLAASSPQSNRSAGRA